jgi:hypothetical protein
MPPQIVKSFAGAFRIATPFADFVATLLYNRRDVRCQFQELISIAGTIPTRGQK